MKTRKIMISIDTGCGDVDRFIIPEINTEDIDTLTDVIEGLVVRHGGDYVNADDDAEESDQD